MQITFALLATIIYLIGMIPYLWHAYHGRVVPHPYSWSIWSIFALTSGYILYDQWWLTIALVPFLVRSIALMIGAYFWWKKRAKISIGRFDRSMLLLAVLSISGMYFYGHSEAVFFIIILDFLILAPTLRKIWDNPDTEEKLAWIMAGVSHTLVLLSIEIIAFSTIGYTIYNILINFAVAFLIYRRHEYVQRFHYRFKKYFSFFALKKKLW